MSQDVEIIEVDEEVIEISDEEDCKVLVVHIDDDEISEGISENELSQNEVLHVNKMQQQLTRQFFNNCSSKGNATEPAENSCGTEIKQENNINNSVPETKPNISFSIHNSVSQANTSGKRKRKRNRGKRRKKLSGTVSKELEPNVCNNQINSSPNFVEVPRSSNSTNLSDTFNFSKLKWLKPLSNLSSPPHLQMVIIDRNHPDWRMENDKWLMIEKRLLETLNTEMICSNDPSIGLFDGAKWQRGIKIIGCQNENAFNFIRNFFNNMDKPWNGTILDAFPITNISRHIVKAYIPPPTIKTELIMSLIKLQNPSVYSSDWKIVRERERTVNGGLDIWISVNEQSFMQLSKIRGEIKFGINRIFINPAS